MPNNEHGWRLALENQKMERAERGAVYVLTPVGTPVLQVLWPTETMAQIGEKTLFQSWKGKIPSKNRRTIQVLNATLSVHGRTADGMGATTG